jgi:cobalt/nickel transport system permease protein
MFELFSDIYADHSNRFTRMDARAKLFAAAVTLVAVIAAPGPALPVMIWLLSVGALLSARVGAKMISARTLSPLMMAGVLLIVNTLLSGKTPFVTFSLGQWHVSFMKEGLHQGIFLASRVIGATGVLLFLSFTTPAHRIFSALRWYGAPESWVELATSIYRHTFTLIDTASDMYYAQRVRLGYRDARHSLESSGTLVGSVLLRSIEQSARTHEAMVARGYTGGTVFGPHPRLAAGDALAAAVWVACIFALFAAVRVKGI